MHLISGLLVVGGVVAFPDYDAPVTAVPAPRPRQGEGVTCTVPLISHAELNDYNLVVQEPWAGVPTACNGGEHGENWDLIVLEFNGNVAGVQFDRFGAMWFGGVELLRTTTPEPATGTLAGTHWKIQKDVTDYANLFTAEAGSVNASVAIPNVITAVYTGVEYVSVTIKFYSPVATTTASAATKMPPTVLPLADPTSNFMSIMALTNETAGLAHSLALPENVAGKVQRAFLDVYCSNHGGSEEFWYLTPSAYREINLYIDGCLAAAWYPELVVYTGGICPLLWRPLVSYLALDVPARRLDITAFAGLLNDGKNHSFTFRVVDGDPIGSSGVWFIDPVLVLDLDASATSPHTFYGGELASGSCKPYSINDTDRSIVVTNSKTKGLATDGSFSFAVSGTNFKGGRRTHGRSAGASAATSHKYVLKATNLQQSPDANSTEMPTAGSMSSAVTTTFGGSVSSSSNNGGGDNSSRGSTNNNTHSNGSVDTDSDGRKTGSSTSTHVTEFTEVDESSSDKFSGTFLLTATVNMTRTRTESVEMSVKCSTTAGGEPKSAAPSAPAPPLSRTVSWSLRQNSTGAYNRSESNHTLIYLEENAGSEVYSLSTSKDPCFEHVVTAEAGHMTSDTTRSDGGGKGAGAVCADIPQGLRVCGSELCGFNEF